MKAVHAAGYAKKPAVTIVLLKLLKLLSILSTGINVKHAENVWRYVPAPLLK